jgi:NAD-dependent deacetylase
MAITTDPADGFVQLAALLRACDSAVAFTGAGISTEAGIPDFRSPDSAWKRNRPVPFEDFMAHASHRAESWRRKFAMDDIYGGAQPARGHLALARLVHGGKIDAIITQNIDGLHQASGLGDEHVIELHGNGTYARCLSCGERYELAPIRADFECTGAAPECSCGGFIKGATIAFGQAMPQEPMRRARKLSANCELFIAIGSSLVVYPAAGFPIMAKESGAKLVILNRDPTPLDSAADLIIRADIGDTLGPFLQASVLN